MKNSFLKKFLILSFLILVFSHGALFSQGPERFFDTAELSHKEVRLCVFYPSIGSIKALLALRKNAFIDIKELVVIGVYHEKELTNYQESIKFVKANNLDWFKFHQLSAELKPDLLFKENSCTQEFETIFKKSDGIIFFGGPDIPPSLYKKKTSLLTEITDPYRHFLELSFIYHLLGGFQDEKFKGFLESRPQLPVLGICLGSQSLNVGTGGTLIQDIWSEKYGKIYFEDVVDLGRDNWHTNPHFRLHPEEKLFPDNMHPIKLEEKSTFCTAMGFSSADKPYILSAHHQEVDTLGKGFRIAATSLDGRVVEAIEHKIFPNVLGIQFHPEFPVLWDSEAKFKVAPEDKESTSLRTILENNAPSFEFHRKIWFWFSQKLIENNKNN
jgi:putative glutamine amidotransferase